MPTLNAKPEKKSTLGAEQRVVLKTLKRAAMQRSNAPTALSRTNCMTTMKEKAAYTFTSAT
jgi:hypothetical protein